VESFIIQDATQEDVQQFEAGMNAYNNTHVQFDQTPEFIMYNRTIKHDGKVAAGMVAEIYFWNVLTVSILWVDEAHRGKGYGAALLADAESEARKRGGTLAHLNTFDFQAREFYEKQGYAVFGVLEGYPEGRCRYYMSKKL